MSRSFKLPLVLSLGLILSLEACAPAFCAEPEKIRDLIQNAEIVPNDYRQQLNIVCKDTVVSISVYKDPDASLTDCKIDAVLIAEKVLEAAPETKQVSVFFYDLAPDDKLTQVDVPTSAVAAFAQGTLSKSGLLKATTLSAKQTNNLASSYSGQTYKQMIEKLGVIAGPSEGQRAQALVRIDDLASKGRDTLDLKRKYLHIEDLTRRGDAVTMRRELKELNNALNQLVGSDNRESKLDSISAASSRVNE